MAGRGGSPSQWLLLLWAVVASLVFNSSPCSGEYNICNIKCCRLQPSSSDDPLQVDCECPDMDSMTLRQGDIPASVQSITISGPAQLTFQKHAFYGLPSLVTLEVDLHHKGKLNISENGLALPHKNSTFSWIIIENAKAVDLANSAFAGFWNPAAMIKVYNVKRLYIHKNGFSFRSNLTGPSLIIDFVQNLDMASNALNATISSLIMSNVHMPACLKGNFGGQISRMEMNHVQINQVRERCFTASSMTKLSIVASDFERIQMQGFSGDIYDVDIKDTNVTKIDPYGFALQVATLHIKNCLIGNLMANGLNVTANDSIKLERVNITTLSAQALTSLMSLQRAMDIHDVSITHTEYGSFAFSKEAKIRFTGQLHVVVPDPPICPTKKWVHWLVGKPEINQLTDADNKLLSQLQGSWFCPDTDTVDLSQKRTETGHSGSQLGDEGMGTPRTTYKPDASHEIGFSNTPEDETSTQSEVTPKEDVHAPPSHEPEMTGPLSTTWIVVMVVTAFVMGIVVGIVIDARFPNAVAALRKAALYKQINASDEGDADSH